MKEDLKTEIYYNYIKHIKKCLKSYNNMEKVGLHNLATKIYKENNNIYYNLHDFLKSMNSALAKYHRIYNDRQFYNKRDSDNINNIISSLIRFPHKFGIVEFKIFRRKFICQNIINY